MVFHTRCPSLWHCIRNVGLLVACSAAMLNAQAQETPSPQSQIPQNAPPTGGEIPRQEENKKPGIPVASERWNLFWQATSIGQYHGTFRSPYASGFSLRNYSERVVSLTSTLFFGL